MELFYQLSIGSAMIALTVAIQAMAFDFIIKRIKHATAFLRHRTHIWKPIISGLMVVMIFSVHVLQIWLWAILYLFHDAVALHTLADALYFSTVTFSTVGYGDITLDESTRMLSAIEAANGFLLFGWTTAFIFEVISQLYKTETRSL